MFLSLHTCHYQLQLKIGFTLEFLIGFSSIFIDEMTNAQFSIISIHVEFYLTLLRVFYKEQHEQRINKTQKQNIIIAICSPFYCLVLHIYALLLANVCALSLLWSTRLVHVSNILQLMTFNRPQHTDVEKCTQPNAFYKAFNCQSVCICQTSLRFECRQH